MYRSVTLRYMYMERSFFLICQSKYFFHVSSCLYNLLADLRNLYCLLSFALVFRLNLIDNQFSYTSRISIAPEGTKGQPPFIQTLAALNIRTSERQSSV